SEGWGRFRSAAVYVAGLQFHGRRAWSDWAGRLCRRSHRLLPADRRHTADLACNAGANWRGAVPELPYRAHGRRDGAGGVLGLRDADGLVARGRLSRLYRRRTHQEGLNGRARPLSGLHQSLRPAAAIDRATARLALALLPQIERGGETMKSFEDRQKGFEAAFQRDQELAFRITARRNR